MTHRLGDIKENYNVKMKMMKNIKMKVMFIMIIIIMFMMIIIIFFLFITHRDTLTYTLSKGISPSFFGSHVRYLERTMY